MFRANPINPKGFQSNYPFNISKYYRIWYSKNPAVFLGIENELRFIRMRTNNPKAELFFIYSSRCLNSEALRQLNLFCSKHHIKSIDFDTIILPLLQNERDKKIYELAQQEIEQTLQQNYGNLAAAADLTRLIVPLIQEYGIYSDHDVECSLSNLPADVISIKAPVLLNCEMVVDVTDGTLINPNSDFLAFAFNPSNPKQLCTEAQLAIRFMQDEIINKKSEAISLNTFYTDDKLNNIISPTVKQIFDKFVQQNPEGSIFDFRKFVSTVNIPGLSLQMQNTLKNHLMQVSVICIAGPGIYTALYKQLRPKGVGAIPTLIPPNDTAWAAYVDMFRKSSVGYYDPIADRITSNNCIEFAVKLKNTPEMGDCGDLSWLDAGLAVKQARENKMKHAVSVIQRFWQQRKHNGEPVSANTKVGVRSGLAYCP